MHAMARTRQGKQRLSWSYTIVLALAVLTTPARAADQEISRLILDLRVSLAEMPSHLCVITERGAPGTTIEIGDKQLGGKFVNGAWRFQPPSARANGAEVQHVLSAVQAMVPRAWEDASCGAAGLAMCDPGIEVGSLRGLQGAGVTTDSDPNAAPDSARWHLQCGVNERGVQGSRVAVVHIDFHLARGNAKDEIGIKEVRLDGTVATIHLFRGDKDKPFGLGDIATATSVGGYYARGESVANLQERITVPLEPRCAEHEVETPPFEQAGGTQACVELTQDGKSLITQNVTIDQSGRFKAWLPYRIDPSTKTLSMELDDPKSGGGYRFEGRWIDRKAPQVVRLNAKTVSFSWARHCLYPQGASCPEAKLEDVGVSCTSQTERGGKCSYTCGTAVRTQGAAQRARPGSPLKPNAAPQTLEFALPVRVRFRVAKDEDTWEEMLTYGGQRLSGYVAPEDRYVVVDFSSWSQTAGEGLQAVMRRPGESIDYVSVRAPGQGEATFKPENGRQRIRVPGVRCDDLLTYQIVGDRSYSPGVAQVEGGVVALPSPTRLESDVLSFGVAIGSGGVVMFDLADSAARELPSRPLAVLQGIAMIRALPIAFPDAPAILRPIIELRGGFIATTHVFYPLRSTESASDEGEDIWFSRYPIDVVAVWPLTADFYAGLSAGALLGHPFSPSDYARGGELQGSFSTTLLVGYRLGRSGASLETSARLSTDENVRIFDALEFRGAGRSEDHGLSTLMLDLKLRMGL